MKAYYFAPQDNKLRYDDNREIVVGKMHTVKCKPILCKQGLHGSVKPLDALKYAPGSMLYVVDISRNIAVGADKICGQRREYLFGFDATEILFLFARKQALINIEKIKPYTDKYDLIVEYLNIGAECLKSAAESAAESAAWSATKYSAWSATGSAAESSADSAAWSATKYSAWSATGSAAGSAAEYAAWYAAFSATKCSSKSSAWSSAWSAAWSSAWSAAESAAESTDEFATKYPAKSAAWSSAWSAAEYSANEMLEDMIIAELTKRGYNHHA